jgi:hypothetical protein
VLRAVTVLVAIGLPFALDAAFEARVKKVVPPQAAGRCELADVRTTRYRYDVMGRARPVLVWTRRRNVGDAYVTRELAANGQTLELLIGTDPGRAPFKLNRWGHIAEQTCAGRTDVRGVMTQSDDEMVEGAREVTDGPAPGAHAYRAIRASVGPEIAEAERFRLTTDRTFTFRDKDALVAILPPPDAKRQVRVPAGAWPGFLSAVAQALSRAAANPAAGTSTVAYVYGWRVYDLKMTAKAPESLTLGTRRYEQVVTADFEIAGRGSRGVTHFQITFGTSSTGSDLAGIPLRIVYRPQWLLELELVLAGVTR